MSHDRLLEIAIGEFGAKGMEGASTRGIAAAAGTAMSAITYHYGGKEGLYLAAAEHIAAGMARELAPALVAERNVAADDPVGARAAIHRLLDRFIDKVAAHDGGDWGLFILREQLHPTPAFDRIYSGLMGQLLERLVDLICIATGIRDRRTSAIGAITLMGQVMAPRAMRAAALRLLEVKALDAAVLHALRDRVRANADAILDTMIAERQEQR